MNGDLFRLGPGPDFEPVGPGESLRLEYLTAAWSILETDGPDGFYFVFETDDGPIAESVSDVHVPPFQRPEQLRRSASDVWPVSTAATRFATYSKLSLLAPSAFPPILPTPLRVEPGAGSIAIEKLTQVHFDPGVRGEAAYLAERLQTILGRRPALVEGIGPTTASVLLQTGNLTVGGQTMSEGDEAYTLHVEPDGYVAISGSDAAGVFYGIQSLLSLIETAQLNEGIITTVRIEDRPRFGYRGLMLDVARNFHTKEWVMELLDVMASYKLNRFHFHLTDDEAWRFSISGLPELTEIGGRRGHTESELDYLAPSLGSGPTVDSHPGSGFYSRQEFIEILRHANERHITVIPEIDMPGHARAAIRAMHGRYSRALAAGDEPGASEYLLRDPEDSSEYVSVQMWRDNVVDVCRHSTYHFLEAVVDDVVSMFDEAGAPLTAIHTGGDEVPAHAWDHTTSCTSLERGELDEEGLARYFADQFHQIIADAGLTTAGWEEIALAKDPATGRPAPDRSRVGQDYRPYVWNSVWGWGGEDTAYRLANAGFPIVMSNASNLYFDLAYEKSPEEPGAYWAGFVDTRSAFELIPHDIYKNARRNLMGVAISRQQYADAEVLRPEASRNILGIQGQLWSENARSSELAEYLLFPKLLGLAERAWSPDPDWARIEDDGERGAAVDMAWNEFANTLGQRELARLARRPYAVGFRVPPPGAVVENGFLHANVGFPGMEIRFTTDGSTPGADSALYTGPVEVSSSINLRAFAADNRGSRLVSVAAGGVDR